MRNIMTVVLAGAALATGGSANAQGWGWRWGVYAGNRSPYYDGYRDNPYDRQIDYLCSGQRARALEARLRHEEEEDEIDVDDARRIHGEIDDLEGKQDHECEEGDWRALRGISYHYDRIERWIEREAHGDWRGGW